MTTIQNTPGQETAPTQSALASMQRDREAALATYAELLDPHRQPVADDGDKLRRVMATLGLTLATIERHAEIRRRASGRGQIERRLEEIDAERDAASREFLEAEEKFREVERDWRYERARMLIRNRGLESQADSLKNKIDRINDLQRNHPLAFGREPEASDAE